MNRVDGKTPFAVCGMTSDASGPLDDAFLDETSQDARVAALLEEFEMRNRGGTVISFDEFLAQHQDVAAPLKECLQGLQVLQSATTVAPLQPTILSPGTRLGDF